VITRFLRAGQVGLSSDLLSYQRGKIGRPGCSGPKPLPVSVTDNLDNLGNLLGELSFERA
jgi:hypothetical protein